ncbi:MAG: oligosaccharide flippase family protein [Thermodesulfobacteriota bacterium]
MLKKIFESTLTMGATSAMVIVIDLVRVKCIAVMLGPTGVGVLSILNHFQAVLFTLVGLGLSTGVIKYISEYNASGDSRALQSVLQNAWSILFPVSLAALLLCVLLSVPLSSWILEDTGYSLFVIVYACSLPVAVYPLVGNALLQGTLKIGALARINILRALLTLVLVVPLIYFFGLAGAVVSALAAALVHLVISRHYVRTQAAGFSVAAFGRIQPETARKLFHYGMTSLLVGAAMYISHLFLKTTIVHALGQRLNGIYQPIWALTMAYPTIVLSSMSAYSYPRMCGIKENRDMVSELNGTFRIALLFITPIMLVLLAARRPVIELLYSAEFLESAAIMHIQILGDLLRVVFWALGMYLLPMRRLSAFIFVNISQNVLLVAGALLLVGPYGLEGVAWAFTASWVIPSLAVWIHAKRSLGFSFWGVNRVLLFSSALAIILIAVCQTKPGLALNLGAPALVASAWVLLNLDRQELAKFLEYARERLSRKGRPGR